MRPYRLIPVLVLVAGVLGGCRSSPLLPDRSSARSLAAPGPDAQPSSAGAAAFVRCAGLHERDWISTCRPVNPRSAPLGEVYADVQAVAFPAWGPSVALGQVFSRTGLATWSFEAEATWQDLGSSIGGEADGGSFAQVRGSVKAEFLPCRRGHPTARAGFGWFRTTEETDWVNDAADYIAFHLGLGYEFAVTPQFTTGPEIVGLLAAEEKGFDLEFVPQARWHFIWKF